MKKKHSEKDKLVFNTLTVTEKMSVYDHKSTYASKFSWFIYGTRCCETVKGFIYNNGTLDFLTTGIFVVRMSRYSG